MYKIVLKKNYIEKAPLRIFNEIYVEKYKWVITRLQIKLIWLITE